MVADGNANFATSKLSIALDCVAAGYSVVPVDQHKKAHVLWTEFQERRPTAKEVKTWWKQWPDANVSIVAGRISGVIAIDFDSKDALEWAKAQGLELPATRVVKSSRGWHFWYKAPDTPRLQTHIKWRKSEVDSIDLVADKHLLTIPGSVHASGHVYSIVRDLPIADAPAWLVEAIRPPAPPEPKPSQPIELRATDEQIAAYVRSAFDNIISELSSLTAGRNNGLVKAAFGLGQFVGGGYISRTDAERELENAAHNNGYISKDGRDAALATIKSGLDKGTLEPRDLNHLERNRTTVKYIHPAPTKTEINPFVDGVPNEIVAAINQNFPKGNANVYRLIAIAVNQGLLKTSGFTCDEVITANQTLKIDIPPVTIRRKIRELYQLGFLSIGVVSSNSTLTLHIDKKSTGRRPTIYTIKGDLDDHADLTTDAAKVRIVSGLSKNGVPPVISEDFLTDLDDNQAVSHARELNAHLTWTEKSLLRQARKELDAVKESLQTRTVRPWRPDVPWRNSRELSIALARADGEAHPDQHPPNRILALRYGCSMSRVRAVQKKAGIDTEQRPATVVIKALDGKIERKPSEPCKLIRLSATDSYGCTIQEKDPSKFDNFYARHERVIGIYKLPSRSMTRLDWRPGDDGETLTRKGGKRARKAIAATVAVAMPMALDEPPPAKPDPEPKQWVNPYRLGAEWCRAWALRLTGLPADDPISNAELVLLLIDARRNARAYEALRTTDSREAFRDKLSERKHRALFTELNRLADSRAKEKEWRLNHVRTR